MVVFVPVYDATIIFGFLKSQALKMTAAYGSRCQWLLETLYGHGILHPCKQTLAKAWQVLAPRPSCFEILERAMADAP